MHDALAYKYTTITTTYRVGGQTWSVLPTTDQTVWRGPRTRDGNSPEGFRRPLRCRSRRAQDTTLLPISDKGGREGGYELRKLDM